MLTTQQRSDDEEAVYTALKNNIMAELRVATFAVVTAVQSDGLLRIKPVINDRIVNDDGSIKWQEYPEIPDTPYADTITNPKVGDIVLLTFCDHDISGFLGSGGSDTSGNPSPVNQNLISSHNLSNAVATARIKNSTSSISPASYAPITGVSLINNGTGISDAGLVFIESYEGLVLDWYDDGTGTMTIGYGHTGALPSGYTAPLTPTTASALLNHDLASRISAVSSAFGAYPLLQNEFDAMVSFTFNLGTGPLGEMALLIINGINNNDLHQQFVEYCHAGGKVLQGLVKRRDAEWAMYAQGVYQI